MTRPAARSRATRCSASLSKSITALAVTEDGRLSLDGPVRQHLPQFRFDDPRSDQITVGELVDPLPARTWQWARHRRDSPTSIADPEAASARRAARAAGAPASQVLATSPSTS
jgi:hypothetical protein